MKSINFIKMDGFGNDFIILDNVEIKEKNLEISKDFITKICNRNFGIGSDGLILSDKGEKTYLKYVMFNPDGTEVEIGGIGMVCYMKYLIDNKIINKNKARVETLSGIVNLEIQGDIITLNIGQPKIMNDLAYETKKIGDTFLIKVDEKIFKFTPISMGNSHAVIFLKPNELGNFEVKRYGRAIEKNNEIFPNKTNVEFIDIVSRTEINMRVWKIGHSEILASGTGACASVVAGVLSGELEKDNFIKVNLPGGVLEVKWSGDKKDSVIMRGKAEKTFEGVYYINE